MARRSALVRSVVAALALFAGVFALAAPALSAGLLERGIWLSGPRYDGDLPGCEAALDTIASRFSQKEAGFWNSALAITGFDKVREIAFRPWASDSIPRRFCTARAMVSDGKLRTVNFSIIEDGGFAGFGMGVEWCVVGLDRNWAYNPACRMARH